ncbi:MAG: alcohol dehydrogenase [Deltaproteobacteria bacterium HGW-Deltaproteobacteria-14]|jgi:NADPH:quinone reductase-like Zn-dependent oxidoreductase|nr:MAG: alcohol dehydrogenase [Deltaproteobacteria bacterium HGW-Deltaproteobacteria-14]
MRQIWIPKIGAPEVLEVREAPEPEPGAGQVRIRVAAAGINFADIMARMGLYPDAPKLPCVVGYEVAGDVDAVGSGVSGVRVGDRVLAATRFGGYSDTLCAEVGLVVPLPAALTYEQGAAIPVNYLTAWLMLVYLGNVHPGERVLVHAAAGGVGQAAVQIARHRGAEVIGTASASKHARLKEQGVAHCIDYRTEDFEAAVKRITGGAGVHVALDAVGGASLGKSYRSLAPTGRVFAFGASSFAPGQQRSLFSALKGLFRMPKFRPLEMMGDNRGVFGVNLGHLWDEHALLRGMLGEIVALTADGVLTPTIDQAFSFDRAGEAHAYIQARKNFGKVLLTP